MEGGARDGGGGGGLLDGIAPRAGTTRQQPTSSRPVVIEPIDRTLAGLVEVSR